jgi:hypothetical protein
LGLVEAFLDGARRFLGFGSLVVILTDSLLAFLARSDLGTILKAPKINSGWLVAVVTNEHNVGHVYWSFLLNPAALTNAWIWLNMASYNVDSFDNNSVFL